jgi:tRNA (cmo5U34)-methyltransferase
MHESQGRQPDASFDFDGEYGADYRALARRVIPAYDQIFKIGLAALRGVVPREAEVLVVGCGTGAEMVTFGRAEPAWRLTGVDPSAQMIDLARRALEEAGLRGGHTLHRGFVDELPVDSTFHAATIFNVMHFLPDDGSKLSLLTSVRARLRPGAPLFLFDLGGDPDSVEFAELHGAWERFMALNGFDGADRDQFLGRLREGMHYVSPARTETLLAAAGLCGITMYFTAFLYRGWRARRAPEAGST